MEDREARRAARKARREAANTSTTPKSETKVAEVAEVKAPTVTGSKVHSAGMEAEGFHPADTNGDGIVTQEEHEMYLEFKRKELEDADAMRDAQRSMAWFALFGMLLYPFAVVLAVLLGLPSAATILGNMAATYFVSVAAIVAAFFGGQAFSAKKDKRK